MISSLSFILLMASYNVAEPIDPRPLEMPGIRIVDRTQLFRSVKAAEKCEDKDFGIKCTDCQTVKVCLGNEIAYHFNCADSDPKTPYCSENICTSELSSNGSTTCNTKSDFHCTSEGTFPGTYTIIKIIPLDAKRKARAVKKSPGDRME